jgi:hypothetical protein
MSESPLEDLPFDELRHQAFHLAEKKLDIGFFTDVFSHMPGMVAIEGEGGDLGSIGGTFIETVLATKQMFGHGEIDPDTQTLLRARFATYIRANDPDHQ